MLFEICLCFIVPPQLAPPSTSFTTLTTILLSWVRPDPPHGIITGYDISFKVADEISSHQTVGLDVAEIIPKNQPSYTLNNLKPVTIYSVMVSLTESKSPTFIDIFISWKGFIL